MNIYANYMIGPEKMNNNSDNRSVMDFVAIYTPVDEVTFGFNIDYGREQHAAVDNCTAEWFGIAGYIKYRVTEKFSLALRLEQFNDEDGVRTGIIQRLQEITFSPEYSFSENFIVRADWRYDKSDKTVFQKKNGLVDSQPLIAFNFIYLF
jgi:predicted porin